MIASGQEGVNPIIKIWDFETGKCHCIISTEFSSIKCLSFSPDGNFLAAAGKDSNNREQIIVWNVDKVENYVKPEIIAK